MRARVEARAGFCGVWKADWERDSWFDVRSFGRGGAANNGADSSGRLRRRRDRRGARRGSAVLLVAALASGERFVGSGVLEEGFGCVTDPLWVGWVESQT